MDARTLSSHAAIAEAPASEVRLRVAAPAPAERPNLPPAETREQRRSRRKREVRAKTISVKRMTKRELALGRLLYPPEDDEPRPKTRADCAGVPRPCPFVSCKHHLYLDVSPRTGAIKVNFPDLEPHELPPGGSCALDVAEAGGIPLERVGEVMNLTRERIRQVEVRGLANLQRAKEMMVLRDYVDAGPVGKRRLPVLVDDCDDEEDSPGDGVRCLSGLGAPARDFTTAAEQARSWMPLDAIGAERARDDWGGVPVAAMGKGTR